MTDQSDLTRWEWKVWDALEEPLTEGPLFDLNWIDDNEAFTALVKKIAKELKNG